MRTRCSKACKYRNYSGKSQESQTLEENYDGNGKQHCPAGYHCRPAEVGSNPASKPYSQYHRQQRHCKNACGKGQERGELHPGQRLGATYRKSIDTGCDTSQEDVPETTEVPPLRFIPNSVVQHTGAHIEKKGCADEFGDT